MTPRERPDGIGQIAAITHIDPRAAALARGVLVDRVRRRVMAPAEALEMAAMLGIGPDSGGGGEQ